MAGIIRYGTYIPYSRITRAALGGGKGERAVAGYDEDSVSLAVEAAREALPGAPAIDTLLFATTSLPAPLDGLARCWDGVSATEPRDNVHNRVASPPLNNRLF